MLSENTARWGTKAKPSANTDGFAVCGSPASSDLSHTLVGFARTKVSRKIRPTDRRSASR